MEKKGFKPRRIKKFSNVFYVKQVMPIINQTHDEGDCVSDNEITIAFQYLKHKMTNH